MKTDCEPFRELLALRLYDELSNDEDRRLGEHLQQCHDCTAFAGELEVGLGRQPASPAAGGDLPAGLL